MREIKREGGRERERDREIERERGTDRQSQSIQIVKTQSRAASLLRN